MLIWPILRNYNDNVIINKLRPYKAQLIEILLLLCLLQKCLASLGLDPLARLLVFAVQNDVCIILTYNLHYSKVLYNAFRSSSV